MVAFAILNLLCITHVWTTHEECLVESNCNSFDNVKILINIGV